MLWAVANTTCRVWSREARRAAGTAATSVPAPPPDELSTAAGRSPSGVQRHLDRLRGEGALGFSVDFDPRLLGYDMTTRLWLNVAPAHLRTVGETLATHPEIAFAAAVTGPSNLVASGVFRTPADLYDYIDRRVGPLPGIRSMETAPTLREVKRLVPALP